VKRQKIEVKLIAELMKNSRKSDRELAKLLGVSQPTISRMREKLEREGYIKEYTMIPDFNKLGFGIIALTFLNIPESVTPNNLRNLRNLRKAAAEIAEKNPVAALMGMHGMGLNYDRVIVTFHEDYTSFLETKKLIRLLPGVEVHNIQSFLIDLRDKEQFHPLSFSSLANYISRKNEKYMNNRQGKPK